MLRLYLSFCFNMSLSMANKFFKTFYHAYIRLSLICMSFLLNACSPQVNSPGKVINIPKLSEDAYLTGDGLKLPVRRWMPKNPSAILIALHGFNDYSRSFEDPGDFFKKHRIGTYAYDQRGFGNNIKRGLWSGIASHARDLIAFTKLVREHHPGIPVFLLGESMGGAVIIVAMTSKTPPESDGIILSAPAVWGRETMPWYQAILLGIASHTVPWLKVSGKGLNVKPTDNIKLLQTLSSDPFIIRTTRVDALYGLTNLMDSAFRRSSKLTMPTLLLYGKKDQIIPLESTRKMLKRLPSSDNIRVAFYEKGHHFLLRDLHAKTVLRDIKAWIKKPSNHLLPSQLTIQTTALMH